MAEKKVEEVIDYSDDPFKGHSKEKALKEKVEDDIENIVDKSNDVVDKIDDKIDHVIDVSKDKLEDIVTPKEDKKVVDLSEHKDHHGSIKAGDTPKIINKLDGVKEVDLSKYNNNLTLKDLKDESSYLLLAKITSIKASEGLIEFKIVNGHSIQIPKDKYEFEYADINVGDVVEIRKDNGMYYISKSSTKVSESKMIAQTPNQPKATTSFDSLFKEDEHTSFGTKIKSIAKIFFILNLVFVLIYFLMLISYATLPAFATLLLGIFGAWVGYVLLYGFGELIENTFYIKKKLYEDK